MLIEEAQAFGRKFGKTEWLDHNGLRAYQAPLIGKLLAHARQTVDFYRDRIDFDSGSLDGIEQNWTRLPILTRAQAVAHREHLKSRRIPAEAGRSIAGETSGSTGMPLAFRTSQISVSVDAALTERMMRWWAVDGKKALAFIIQDRDGNSPPPHGSTTRGWHSARPNGCRHTLSYTADVDTQLKWLAARRPNYLFSYSAILRELALTAKSRGLEMVFELLFSGAAVVEPETRALCRSVFGADIADGYGAQEVGHLAAQCRECGEYHVSAEGNVVEILRDDDTPATPGDIGRVIVTPLYNYAMPLIRYELGDLAEVGAAKPACGRGLPTLRRILGRYRNMFRFRDGTVVWPYDAAFDLERFIALKQFQIVQTDFERIEIRYVPDSRDRPIDLPALTEHVRQALRQPVEVVLAPLSQIERSRSGKFEECISLVARS